MLRNLKKQDKKSKSISPKFRIYLAKLSDVDIEKWPVAVKATIDKNVLLPGKKFFFLDSTPTSINPSVAPGQSPANGVMTLTPIIEGISDEVLEWLYANVGEDFIVIWVVCTTNEMFIAGNPCSSGLRLSYTNIGKLDDGTGGAALQLQGQECPEPFYKYTGLLEVDAEAPAPPTDTKK